MTSPLPAVSVDEIVGVFKRCSDELSSIEFKDAVNIRDNSAAMNNIHTCFLSLTLYLKPALLAYLGGFR
jgi:hypothetical protein